MYTATIPVTSTNLGPQGQGMRKMAAVTVSFPLRPNKSMAPQVDHLGIKVWGSTLLYLIDFYLTYMQLVV